jgi:hypothetical protein
MNTPETHEIELTSIKPKHELDQLFTLLQEIYKCNYKYIGEYETAVNEFKRDFDFLQKFPEHYFGQQTSKFASILERASDAQREDFERSDNILFISTVAVLAIVLAISSSFGAPLGVFVLAGIVATGVYAFLKCSNTMNLKSCTLELDKFKVKQNSFFNQLKESASATTLPSMNA